MSMPWDRFGPDELEEPELPYKPPAEPPYTLPLPSPPVYAPPTDPTPPKHAAPALTDVDVKDLARDLLAEAMDYAKATVSASVKGQDVDVLHPTVTAVTESGKELVVADAKSRSWRTLVQGLIFDVFAAIVTSIAMLSGMDPLAGETWLFFGALLLKSVVSAVISYFMRLKVTPTIKTPEGKKMALMPIPRPMAGEGTGRHDRHD